MTQTAKMRGNHSSLCILNCLNGDRAAVEGATFVIGAAPGSNLQLNSPQCPQLLCRISRNGEAMDLQFSCAVQIDGSEASSLRCLPGEEHTVIGGGHLLAFKHTTQVDAWLALARDNSWYVYSSEKHAWNGLFGPEYLKTWLSQFSANARKQLLLIPNGMEQMGFYIHDAKDILMIPAPMTAPAEKAAWFDRYSSESKGSAAEPAVTGMDLNSEYGEFTCPICWFKFDRGDVMNIAVHNSLRGDPMLGDEAMQRFHATRFNDRGQALDAMGLATSELACPHCRRKLPPGFLDLPHHIFSIVGAPSSGKSYYLSVLVKLLQNSLFQNFGITFRDADPSENVILTQMKTQLFSSSSPEDAFLAKTDLEGALYETLPRQGRKVRLPKPFIFKLSHPATPDSGFSVVFYDNAGEHFEPTRNSADSPGAQHIAVASGIFFLFDPLHNTEFRAMMTGVTDPQIKKHRIDQQDVILAETEVRIKSLLGMDARQRVATPLAVMVGKYDTWSALLGEQELLPAVVDGVVRLDNIKTNSKRVRDFMVRVCPSIVANAEAISSNVCYFAVSPLGSSPVEFLDREGTPRIGPDPKQINPRHVEVPTLWVLAQAVPEMIPSTSAH
ncbi:MAG: hypothetical protein B7Z37_29180 [Verrucomicrobia bacterium 12-59-8]|nr:MAG: hypothetical protein B7Z37_29180 [Verrucomicrobia bacterium 12-59-8]